MTPTLTRTALLALALALLIAADPAWSQTIRYYHTDITGSVVAVTDEQGNVVERRQYEPYGLPQSAIPDGPGYTGHDMDGETGLVYMQQRYYDPMVGRFLSVDPAAVSGTDGTNFNRYWYANNNPYKHVDPDGELAFLIPVAILAYRAYSVASTSDKAIAGAELIGSLVGGKVGRQVAGRAARGGRDAIKPTMGRNPRDGGSRTNTDLGPNGDRASARSVFRNQAEGSKTAAAMEDGGIRVRAENDVQIRYHSDGSTRVDLPSRGPQPNGETIHVPPPRPVREIER